MTDQTKTRPGYLRRMFALTFGFKRPPAPPAACTDCGEAHEESPLAAALKAAFGPSEAVTSRTWAPAFARKVKSGDVVNIPRSELARVALSVLEVDRHEDPEDPLHGSVSLLAVNAADPGAEPIAATIPGVAAVRIEVSAPDSPADLGGAR